ncbi:MAG: hypothetical protein WC405_19410, partial [Syntrophales bacterium]
MQYKKLINFCLAVSVCIILSGCALQKSSPVIKAADLNPRLTAGDVSQKVDAFEVIVDASMSMNEAYAGKAKLTQEKKLITLMSKTIPNLKLTGAARSFGRYSMFGDDTSMLIYGPTAYSSAGLLEAVKPVTGNGFSPLSAALDGAAADLKSQSGQLAVIVFSDGEDMGKYNPVAAATRLKKEYGDRICIYTVHIGDSPSGKKMMQQVADAGGCGFTVWADTISSPQGMAGFVERVFLKPYSAPAKIKEEVFVAKAEAKAAPVMITLNIQFATGKATIPKKYDKEVQRLAAYMTKNTNTKAVIEGYTD